MQIKKIFFVADAKSIHTVKWVDYFVDKEYDVYLATFASVNNTSCKNIYFLGKQKTNVAGGNYHYLWSIFELSKIFSKIKPDIINAHYSYSMGFIALLAKKHSKIKTNFSVVCHGSDVLAPPKPYIFDRINRYVVSRCDKVFVVSDQIRDKVEGFGVDVNHIFVGQYGLSIEQKECRKDIDIVSNRAYCPNSRIDFLLDSLDELKNLNLNIIFIMPNIDNTVLEKLVDRYPYIKFYKEMEHIKMLNLITRSKIYISATLSDGTALSLLEAMKLGAIPLVSNIVSNRSWVLDGVNGYLFNGKIDFLFKLKQLLQLERRESMINLNKILISEKASYYKQMKKIETSLITIGKQTI